MAAAVTTTRFGYLLSKIDTPFCISAHREPSHPSHRLGLIPHADVNKSIWDPTVLYSPTYNFNDVSSLPVKLCSSDPRRSHNRSHLRKETAVEPTVKTNAELKLRSP